MAILYAPDVGTLLLCDFRGTMPPEMNKKRPVVVLSCFSYRLCVIVPLSTTEPTPIKSCHCAVYTPDPLPDPYDSESHWAKCDMLCTVSYDRLSLPHRGKDSNGKRIYVIKKVSAHDLNEIRKCVAAVLSLPLPG